MKKKPNQAYPFPALLSFSNSLNVSSNQSKGKVIKIPTPPTEETLLRLNAIAKQTPFCFYYREKENDSL